MELKDLEVYKLAVEIGDECWPIYNKMDWRDKKILGDQWITAIDSIAANIAEGFGRFHYLDKNKFNYNVRSSLIESIHWTETLNKRGKIDQDPYILIIKKLTVLSVKLNNYINSTKVLKYNNRP